MAGEPGRTCARGPRCAGDYQARISGPLLDRIDLQIEVPAVTASDLVLPRPTEDSATVAARVTAARNIQKSRFQALELPGIRTNTDCSAATIEDIAAPDVSGRKLLQEAIGAMRLSARGYHRTLRVARTLADLSGAETVGRNEIAEALGYKGTIGAFHEAA